MALLRCSHCRRVPEVAGCLCAYPAPWDASELYLECGQCTTDRLSGEDGLRVMREDAQDWLDHISTCDWCHANKSLLPKGLLFQACVEIRRNERRKVVAA